MTAVPGLPASLPADALRDVDCALCASAEREVRFTEEPFSVVRCSACGFTYVTPRLSDASLLERVYDEAYWRSDAARTRGYTDYRADALLSLQTYRRRMAVVRRHFARPGRVLDVGCAAGYFLEVMREAGWDVLGLEPSDAIRPQAASRLGDANVIAAPLVDAGLEASSFDLITMWDVLEHIPDFPATLREARRLLAPGGRLLVETQNVRSRAARVLGRRWQHYKHAEHIYHFDPDTLARALDQAGLRVLENSPWLGGKYVSMGFIAERSALLHPVVAALLSPLKLLRGVSLYVNLFDEMIVVAEPAG